MPYSLHSVIQIQKNPQIRSRLLALGRWLVTVTSSQRRGSLPSSREWTSHHTLPGQRQRLGQHPLASLPLLVRALIPSQAPHPLVSANQSQKASLPNGATSRGGLPQGVGGGGNLSVHHTLQECTSYSANYPSRNTALISKWGTRPTCHCWRWGQALGEV